MVEVERRYPFARSEYSDARFDIRSVGNNAREILLNIFAPLFPIRSSPLIREVGNARPRAIPSVASEYSGRGVEEAWKAAYRGICGERCRSSEGSVERGVEGVLT
jgi:hypothetical protein